MTDHIIRIIITTIIAACGILSSYATQLAPSERQKIIRIVADYAARRPDDAAVLRKFRKFETQKALRDSVVYKETLAYLNDIMGAGRQSEAYDLCTNLREVVKTDGDGDERKLNFVLSLNLLNGAAADEIGMTSLALEFYSKGLEAVEKTDNPKLTAGYLNNFGVTYYRVQDYARAAEYFRKALAMNKKLRERSDDRSVRRDIFLNYNNLAEIAKEGGDLDKALNYALLSIQLLDEEADDDLYYYTQTAIGEIYKNKGDYNMALSYISNAIEHQQKLGLKYDLFESYLQISDLYKRQGMSAEALRYASLARTLSDSLENPLCLSRAIERQAELAEAAGDISGSISMLRRSYQLRDSIRLVENRNKMRQSQEIYEIERARVVNGSVISHWNPEVVFFVMAAIVIVLIFFIVKMVMYRRRSDRAIAEARRLDEEVHAAHRRQIEESERSRREIQEALDVTHRQLTTSTMDRVRSRESVNEISTDLKRILLEINPRSRETRDKIQDVIRKLSQFNLQDDWKEFQYYFEKVNPAYYERLAERHPEVTEKDKRLCALLALGLTTKEIASVMCREVRSVESSRNRLRKKLNLDLESNLNDYCRAFTTGYPEENPEVAPASESGQSETE